MEYITPEAKILNEYRTVAVVGASPNPERPSYRVVSYLSDHGYTVIPVNPLAQDIVGQVSYPDISSIPEKVVLLDPIDLHLLWLQRMAFLFWNIQVCRRL